MKPTVLLVGIVAACALSADHAKTFNKRLQFMVLRSIKASGYKETLARYVVRDRLCGLSWTTASSTDARIEF